MSARLGRVRKRSRKCSYFVLSFIFGRSLTLSVGFASPSLSFTRTLWRGRRTQQRAGPVAAPTRSSGRHSTLKRRTIVTRIECPLRAAHARARGWILSKAAGRRHQSVLLNDCRTCPLKVDDALEPRRIVRVCLTCHGRGLVTLGWRRA
jgi:hypothetical protein